ncbi:uncharacterized protein LOC124151230 isoform X2 [Haliotis rufescens]|uniref:uncharacterized protein LOC124151230 isoform X2 n=1 Tax=Haliotis rufescens TaxID=6454 RepID=UPI001EB01676|nr:uncharacterized protein LOC124151230 isoform X2 [Haliotis rufescens]
MLTHHGCERSLPYRPDGHFKTAIDEKRGRPCSQTMNSLRPCVFHNDVVDNNTVHETAYIYRAISPSDQSLFGHSLQPATVPESYIPKNWYSTEFQPTRSSVDTWTGMVTS